MLRQYFFLQKQLVHLNNKKFIFRNVSKILCNTQKFSYSSINNGIKHSEFSEDDKHLNLNTIIKNFNQLKFDNVTSQEGQLLLQCCGSSAYNSSLTTRNEMLQKIYMNLLKHNKSELNIHKTYIQLCTENRILINSKQFLETSKIQPDKEIYALLFENVCECADIDQAFQILETMKKNNFSVDENVFNNLILVHTMHGGLKAAEQVLSTMKTAKVEKSISTHVSILIGIIRSQNYDDLKKFVATYPEKLDENQLLSVANELGLIDAIDWLPEMQSLFTQLSVSREFIKRLKKICISLVHVQNASAAVKLINYFKPETDDLDGLFILEEMLHAKTDYNEIITICKNFYDVSLHPQIFQNLTEVAIRNKYYGIIWTLFENLNELRPHYFWPLFRDAKSTEGEGGIFDIIEKINKLGVKLDSDTLEHYILPYCNQETVIEKLKRQGFTVTEILTPLLLVLLKNGQVKTASQLCDSYNVKINDKKLFKHLCISWSKNKDSSIVNILRKYCEYNNVESDLVGDFLLQSFNSCRISKDFHNFIILIKALQKNNLRITATSANVLKERLAMIEIPMTQSEKILDEIDRILEFKLKTEDSYIPHPRDMNLEQLEGHLIELSTKHMQTRGVIRKLIQMHASVGNTERVQQLRHQFLEAGYKETLGMKSSLMSTYTKTGRVDSALEVYKEIKAADPTFAVDNFKLIDMATELIKRDRFSEAIALLEELSNRHGTIGTENIQRNCVDLLNAFKNENEQSSMFHFLIAKGLCKVTNIILGPLVRIYLNRGDLEKASKVFIDCVEKYKCTPLQFELTRAIVESKNAELMQKVLESSSNVHGPLSTQVVLIGCLAEIGEEKMLQKILTTTKFSISNDVKKKCQRWINEGKADALITLANASSRLPKDVVDTDFIYECVIKTYAMKNECEEAVRFYESLLEKEIPVNKTLEDQLFNLLHLNNFSMPDSLRINREV